MTIKVIDNYIQPNFTCANRIVFVEYSSRKWWNLFFSFVLKIYKDNKRKKKKTERNDFEFCQWQKLVINNHIRSLHAFLYKLWLLRGVNPTRHFIPLFFSLWLSYFVHPYIPPIDVFNMQYPIYPIEYSRWIHSRELCDPHSLPNASLCRSLPSALLFFTRFTLNLLWSPNPV